jgi:hypothetical protein
MKLHHFIRNKEHPATFSGDGGGRGLIMDQDKSMKITDHGKLKIRNHDKNSPFLRAITGHDRTINHGSRYLIYPNHRITPTPVVV